MNVQQPPTGIKFSAISADIGHIDDEWIEYGWCKAYINVEKNGRWRRGLDSMILYRQSEIDGTIFEPFMVVDRYHTLFPNPEIDKRLRDLQSQGRIQILQQSRQLQSNFEMLWLVHPTPQTAGNSELNKPIKIGNKDFYLGAVIKNIEASVGGTISVYPLIYEKIGQHTIMPFICPNYKMKGVRISKEPQMYSRSVGAIEDQIIRCARKAMMYVDYLQEATKHKINEDLIANVLKHYMTINEDYLPYYIYVSRSMREAALQVTIIEEGKDKTLFEVAYDIADQLWEYRQKRLQNAVPGVARLTNGLFLTIESMKLGKAVNEEPEEGEGEGEERDGDDEDEAPPKEGGE